MIRQQATIHAARRGLRTRVAILANYPRDHTTFRSGVETATAALLDGLRAYQDVFEFHVLSLTAAGLADVVEPRDGFWFHFLSVPRHPLARPRLPLRVLKAYRELQRIEPDLVHCQDNMALALTTLLGRYRCIFTIHGVKRDEAGKRTGWEFWSAQVDRLIERYVHRHFDAFVCISRYAAEVVGERAQTFSIPNAVSPQFFRAPDDLAHASAERGPYVVFVGSLARLKRPADLILAHGELRPEFPALESVFCGEVEDRGYANEMRRRIDEQGIAGVRFLGRVGRESLVDLLKGATALVLPSAQENAPMVIAEAMASGTPVVATRVGGIPDMVQDGQTGLLYDVGDVDALTTCLRRLLQEPEFRVRLGREAFDVAQATYAPATVAGSTVDAYRRLLVPCATPRPNASPH